jgi:hypothetical protein
MACGSPIGHTYAGQGFVAFPPSGEQRAPYVPSLRVERCLRRGARSERVAELCRVAYGYGVGLPGGGAAGSEGFP